MKEEEWRFMEEERDQRLEELMKTLATSLA